ncbi:MAG: helix-turn-helix domain-containing protein [Bryobacteraceae bacterium]
MQPSVGQANPLREAICDSDESVWTVDEAHSSFGKKKISRAGFYSAIKRGEVPHVRLGKRILIPKQAFLRWLNHQ